MVYQQRMAALSANSRRKHIENRKKPWQRGTTFSWRAAAAFNMEHVLFAYNALHVPALRFLLIRRSAALSRWRRFARLCCLPHRQTNATPFRLRFRFCLLRFLWVQVSRRRSSISRGSPAAAARAAHRHRNRVGAGVAFSGLRFLLTAAPYAALYWRLCHNASGLSATDYCCAQRHRSSARGDISGGGRGGLKTHRHCRNNEELPSARLLRCCAFKRCLVL
jgi:hypothetical protein